MKRIRLGVSRCLMGDPVRYDGQHKRDAFVVDTLGQFVDYVPVCPEVECGLPIPREAMRLEGNANAPRLMTRSTKRDLTDQMVSWAAARVEGLAGEDLCGFIFKSKSPSSGMERVKVYNGHGGLSGRSPGLFAKAFITRFPLLPVEEEGRLNDPGLRENFITRIFALKRYRDTVKADRGPGALMQFHAEHKYLLMSHGDAAMRQMGRLLADGSRRASTRVAQEYEMMLLNTLGRLATPRKNTNVLTHLLGYFKKLISPDEKKELLEVIDTYHRELVPLIVPITLINHFVRKYDVSYLAQQVYLNPHPLELKLRNHA